MFNCRPGHSCRAPVHSISTDKVLLWSWPPPTLRTWPQCWQTSPHPEGNIWDHNVQNSYSNNVSTNMHTETLLLPFHIEVTFSWPWIWQPYLEVFAHALECLATYLLNLNVKQSVDKSHLGSRLCCHFTVGLWGQRMKGVCKFGPWFEGDSLS